MVKDCKGWWNNKEGKLSRSCLSHRHSRLSLLPCLVSNEHLLAQSQSCFVPLRWKIQSSSWPSSFLSCREEGLQLYSFTPHRLCFLPTRALINLINSQKCQLDHLRSTTFRLLNHTAMMNHGGPPTLAIKRWMAMQDEAAKKAQALPKPTAPHMALLPSVYDSPSSASTSPRANVADEQPLIPDGDIDMGEAPNYVSISFTFSQQPQQLTFASSIVSLAHPACLLTRCATFRPSRRQHSHHRHYGCSSS